MLRGCTRTPMPARAAAVSPLRLPQVQTIRHAIFSRSRASCATRLVMEGGGKAISGSASPRLTIEKPPMRFADMPLGEHEVEVAGILHLVEHGRKRHRQFQVDQRIEADEILQNGGEPVCDHILRHPEPQPPPQPAFAEKRCDLPIEIEHAAGITEQCLALRSQPHLMRVAKNQLPPERFFKPLDMLRHCRLPDPQPDRRFGETPGLLQHDEAVEVMEVEHLNRIS